MDTAAAQKPALVEAVIRPAWKLDLRNHLELGALRRRAARRQLEQHGLVQPIHPKPLDLGRNPDVEAAAASRAGDDDVRPADLPGLVLQPTGVEGVEAAAPPPPAGEDERKREERETAGAADEQ